MLVAAAFGALFSLLLSFASINLRADQTIGGTALNLMAPALVLFFIRIIANQNTLQMLTGDAASWFMIKKSTLGIDKNTDLGFFGETFVNKVYLATYVCILLFIACILFFAATWIIHFIRKKREEKIFADVIHHYAKDLQPGESRTLEFL